MASTSFTNKRARLSNLDTVNNSTPIPITIPLQELKKFKVFREWYPENEMNILTKVKLAYVTEKHAYVVTTTDQVYTISVDRAVIAFCKRRKVEEIKCLSGKGITDIKGDLWAFNWKPDLTVLTKDGLVYTWNYEHSWDQPKLVKGALQEHMFPGPKSKTSKLKRVISIQDGENYTLALTDKGELFSWGRIDQTDDWAAWQNGPTPELISSKRFKGEKVKMISAGSFNSSAITERNKLFCWGMHLGKMFRVPCRPRFLPSQTFKKVVSGKNHTIALATDGKVYQWKIERDDVVAKSGTVTPLEILEYVIDIDAHRYSTIYIYKTDTKIYLQDSSFTVEDDMQVFPIETDLTSISDVYAYHCKYTHKALQASDFVHESVENDLASMWLDQETSDVSFSVERKTIPAHKTILSMQSLYFRRMFSGPWTESKQSCIKITSATYEVFHALLFYFYHNTVCFSTFEDENIIQLAQLADCYRLKHLQDKCEDIIIKKLSTNNVLKLFQLCVTNKALGLETRVLNFLVAHRSKLRVYDEVRLAADLNNEALAKLTLALFRV